MALTGPVTPVKLFAATLHAPEADLDQAINALIEHWGAIDFTSEDFPFHATDYYEPEMGSGLLRRFYSFQKLIVPEEIVDAKLLTNSIEERFRKDHGRSINLDPGYLDFYKVVLASTKFGGQKIYMRNGIYADMTLIMFKGKWESFAWGFPDFKSGAYDNVLFTIRDLYKAQLREIKS